MDERLLHIQATPVKDSELHPGKFVVELEADDFNYLLHKAIEVTDAEIERATKVINTMRHSYMSDEIARAALNAAKETKEWTS